MAQAIQGQILPRGPATVPGFDLAGDYRTGGEVGGDYFDFLPLADGRTMAVIADVSGHDLASGMIMVSARATLRTLATRCSDPAVLFEMLAAGMHQDLWRTERFLTAAAAVLEPGGKRVEIVMAGDNELLLYRAATGKLTAGDGSGHDPRLPRRAPLPERDRGADSGRLPVPLHRRRHRGAGPGRRDVR